MRQLDTQEDILGYGQDYDMVTTQERVHLSIPEGNLRLLLLNYSNDLSIITHLKELVRVYELVRKGKI